MRPLQSSRLDPGAEYTERPGRSPARPQRGQGQGQGQGQGRTRVISRRAEPALRLFPCPCPCPSSLPSPLKSAPLPSDLPESVGGLVLVKAGFVAFAWAGLAFGLAWC